MVKLSDVTNHLLHCTPSSLASTCDHSDKFSIKTAISRAFLSLGVQLKANNQSWIARHCQQVSGCGQVQVRRLTQKKVQRLYQCLGAQ